MTTSLARVVEAHSKERASSFLLSFNLKANPKFIQTWGNISPTLSDFSLLKIQYFLRIGMERTSRIRKEKSSLGDMEIIVCSAEKLEPILKQTQPQLQFTSTEVNNEQEEKDLKLAIQRSMEDVDAFR